MEVESLFGQIDGVMGVLFVSYFQPYTDWHKQKGRVLLMSGTMLGGKGFGTSVLLDL